MLFFFFNATATTEIYTLSLHDALPICGDEPDYVAALEYVHHGWVEPARLESLLSEVVPRMTNQTLAQDPAEFRRKFKGLRQLYLRSHSVYSPGGTRAGEAVSSA